MELARVRDRDGSAKVDSQSRASVLVAAMQFPGVQTQFDAIACVGQDDSRRGCRPPEQRGAI